MMKILLAAPLSTGPLERSYSKLCETCYKDQNNMVLRAQKHYILGALKESKINNDRARLISFNLKYILDFVNSFIC